MYRLIDLPHTHLVNLAASEPDTAAGKAAAAEVARREGAAPQAAKPAKPATPTKRKGKR